HRHRHCLVGEGGLLGDRVEESVNVHRQRHNPRAVQALQRAAETRMRVVEVDECYLGLLL
ncbi:hypothetical protein, partial [Nonomuraea insulae]